MKLLKVVMAISSPENNYAWQNNSTLVNQKPFYSSVKAPSAPNITIAVSQSPTSITLAWTQPEWEVLESYEVSFSYQGPCSGFNHTNTTTVDGTTRQYTLTGLQEFSNYTVTVVAVNGAGRSGGSRESVLTMADGMCYSSIMFWKADTMMTNTQYNIIANSNSIILCRQLAVYYMASITLNTLGSS